jgi:hypothetical protein
MGLLAVGEPPQQEAVGERHEQGRREGGARRSRSAILFFNYAIH